MDLYFMARTFWASLSSSLRMVLRYISFGGLVAFQLAVPLFFVFTSWVVATMIPESTFFPRTTGMTDYMSFITIGFAFNSFIFSAAFGGSHAIRGEQEHGTAELVFVTPASKVAWLFGKMMGQLIFGLMSFFMVLMAGFVLFGFHPETQPNIPAATLSILLTMLAMTAFGLFYAGVCFQAKRHEEITQILWPMMTFFSGLAFPIEVLPQWGQMIAWMIPLTYGVDATRKALLLGVNLSDTTLLTELGVLCIITVALLPIGFLMFKKLEESAKRSGALGTY